MCVCFHATGQGGLVSLSIDRAAQLRLLMGWCDKDSLPKCDSVCVCVRVHVAADQCRSNHPTGAVWSPITLFKQTAQPDTQTRWCLTDHRTTSHPAHHHSVRLHAHYNQIIVNNLIKVTVWLKHSHGLQWSSFPSNPRSHDLLMNGLMSKRMSSSLTWHILLSHSC